MRTRDLDPFLHTDINTNSYTDRHANIDRQKYSLATEGSRRKRVR